MSPRTTETVGKAFAEIAPKCYICMMKIEDELKTTHFQNDKHKAVLSILFTASWLENYINTFLKERDLSHQQYNILRILKGSHPTPLSVIDIKSRMLDRMSNVSRLIEKLKQKKMLTRQEDGHDRRLVQIQLTDAGIAILNCINEQMPVMQDFPETLTCEEAKQLVELLDKLRG